MFILMGEIKQKNQFTSIDFALEKRNEYNVYSVSFRNIWMGM